MKKFFIVLLTICSSAAFANNATFTKLKEVNKCWSEQKDIAAATLPDYQQRSEHEWIRVHLSLVEATLRNRDVTGLTVSQQRNRAQSLNDLHDYWQTGNFPINDLYSFRTPIFIDKYNNFCAVGYLIKASGNEAISRMIEAKTNLAYVREMNYPQLTEWATTYGFTTDELAWIQPGYPPISYSAKVGNGVNGSVQTLFADDAAERLFVGGTFTQVDGAIPAPNIAYVTESGGVYTWHGMGVGVNGTVKAIIKFEDKIFVGGSFSMAGGMPADNVAYWDASGWHSAGCVQGEIRDFAVFEGHLYAGGDFDDCIALTGSDFAKWDGAAWHAIPGITGVVNTLQPVAGSLLIGGAINFGPYPTNAIKWSETTSYLALANNIANEVMDFEVFQDTVYAACKRTDAIDTANLLMLLRGDTWHPAFWIAGEISSFSVTSGSLSFNSLCAEPTSLTIGGHFNYYPMMGTYAQNTIALNGEASWIALDSAVNKVVLFKNELYAGGKFKNGSGPGWGGTTLVNGIARRETPGVGVPEVSGDRTSGIAWPNPASAGSTIHVRTAFNATQYTIKDITGKLQAAGTVDNKQQLVVPDVPSGLYIITWMNENGASEKVKLAVE